MTKSSKKVATGNQVSANVVSVSDTNISANVQIKAVPKVSTTTVNSGYVLMARLDISGKEVLGSEFTISEKTYNRTYKKLTIGVNPTFILKKKG